MKEVTITHPEGYEVGKEKSTFEKIVFKPIDSKPRSWEEYCKRTVLGGQSYIHNNGWIETITEYNKEKMDEVGDRMVLPTKGLAEAFLAMMQLMSLRHAWIGAWNPLSNATPICIWVCPVDERIYAGTCASRKPLSFPTREMAEEFLDCFKDLIETAKPLL